MIAQMTLAMLFTAVGGASKCKLKTNNWTKKIQTFPKIHTFQKFNHFKNSNISKIQTFQKFQKFKHLKNSNISKFLAL